MKYQVSPIRSGVTVLEYLGVEVDDETAEQIEREAAELEASLRAAGIDPDDETVAQAFCDAWMKARTGGA